MKKSGYFWVGYSDLMTSLFFIMLILFVVTITALNTNLEETEAELEKIKELQTAVKELPQDYFSYQPEFKRFKLKQQIRFDVGSIAIKPEYNNYLMEVGNSIAKLIQNLNDNETYKAFDIKYLIVIEGMASQDRYTRNFELSYERALSLYNFWKINGINFDPAICEVQIAGSGTDGVREYSGKEEYLNQQFLIHIVPKIGQITENNELP